MGAVNWINRYDDYGMPAGANGGRFMYTGQLWLGELRLYNYKARMYDPRIGRFVQPDPIGYEDDPNLYAYAGNDPLNRIDPLGLRDVLICTGSRISTGCGGGGLSGGFGGFSSASVTGRIESAGPGRSSPGVSPRGLSGHWERAPGKPTSAILDASGRELQVTITGGGWTFVFETTWVSFPAFALPNMSSGISQVRSATRCLAKIDTDTWITLGLDAVGVAASGFGVAGVWEAGAAAAQGSASALAFGRAALTGDARDTAFALGGVGMTVAEIAGSTGALGIVGKALPGISLAYSAYNLATDGAIALKKAGCF